MLPWVRFNVKMSYQYRNFQYKDETVSQPSHLYNRDSYTGKTVSWYWVGPMATCIFILQQPWHGMDYVWSTVFYEEEFHLPAPYGLQIHVHLPKSFSAWILHRDFTETKFYFSTENNLLLECNDIMIASFVYDWLPCALLMWCSKWIYASHVGVMNIGVIVTIGCRCTDC